MYYIILKPPMSIRLKLPLTFVIYVVFPSLQSLVITLKSRVLEVLSSRFILVSFVFLSLVFLVFSNFNLYLFDSDKKFLVILTVRRSF